MRASTRSQEGEQDSNSAPHVMVSQAESVAKSEQLVSLDVFHSERSWLKAVAPRNMLLQFVTIMIILKHSFDIGNA